MTLVVMQSINVWHERELQLRFFAHLLAIFLLHAEICLRPRMSLGCGVIYLTQEAMIFLCHDTFAWCKLLYTSCETERRVCRLCDLSPRKGTPKQGLPKWWRYHLYILSIPFYTRCSAILKCVCGPEWHLAAVSISSDFWGFSFFSFCCCQFFENNSFPGFW